MTSPSRVFYFLLALALSLAAQPPRTAVELGADLPGAAAAWLPMRGSAPASAATIDGRSVLRLPCNFAGTQIERASWDRKVKLDLIPYQGIQFKLFAKNLAPISHFSVYFQSGNGWYSSTFYPESSSEWNTITIDKSSARSEGRPAGWGAIETIRVSAWRGRDQDTEFYIADIRGIGLLGVDASVVILRAENGQPSSDAVAETLSALGIRYASMSELDVTADRLKAARIVILPNNPSLSDAAAAELIEYLNSGGKLLAFYALPAKLRPVVKIEIGAHIKAEPAGRFSSIRFIPGALAGAPPQVAQRSWNIIAARPVDGAGRVLAEWLDDQGRPAGQAAVVASRNCILMTHVLLKDDPANKRRMLLAMAGSLAPELWTQSVDAAIEGIGRIGPAKNFDQAAALVSRVDADSVRKLRDDARNLNADGDAPAAAQKVAAAGELLMQAFAKAQQPLPGEFRAFWCHRAAGVEGMEWDEAIRQLAVNGFTAILPNMLWGGAAYYPSGVLPVAADVAEQGDQIAKCLAACRKYGLQMHVWKVNWNLGRAAPPAFVEQMRRAARLQVSIKGDEEPWLCPSHPENQKLEIASMVEVARKYAVDGIHFDYIRYPDGNHCFCAGCRGRFARAAGVKIAHWPQDVTGDGALRQQWLDWRRANITAVVKAVSEQARAAKPKIKISAAVFRNWPVDRDGVGQDWKLWCEKGYLDFVCPMDYTASDRQFEVWVESQKEWAGSTPVYPGIGASASSSQFGADRVIGQILITRRHNTNGFVIFNYGVSEAREIVPLLGLGITAKSAQPR